MISRAGLKVLLIDPCFSDKGDVESGHNWISNTSIPLSVGLIGSYLKNQLPELKITILKTSNDIISFIDKEKPDILGICNYLWNTNLSVRLSHYAREVNPKVFIVFGGPEINKNPVDRKVFLKKYAHADMLIEHEGEIAFAKLVKSYIEEEGDTKKIRSKINELGNCFYISEDKQIVAGPRILRINNLNDVPSPYLTGLMDHFLKEGNYQPLIQTNRGCPYACTFCQEGSKYYNKINYHSLDYVKEELDYIAERVNPKVGLFIVDSNWGMYKQDVEIAYHLKKLKEKYNWPMYINSSTGKSQLARIKHVAKILDGSLRISNAVQSMNNDVLDAIKRKNASTLKEFLKGLKMVSVPDIILPLPKETRKTFIDGLNLLLNTKAPIRFTVFHALLLSNTEMNDKEIVEKNSLKVRYRQHQNLTGWVAGKLVCETERNIFETATMNSEDVFQCRMYAVIMDALIREEPLSEIFYYLDIKNIKRSVLPMAMYDNLDKAPIEIQKCMKKYVDLITSETFSTEEEVFEYMKKYSEDYTYGRKGGDLLRYSQKLWIDHFDDMMEWVFQHLNIICAGKKQIEKELDNLREFLTSLYHEKSKSNTGNPLIKKKFDYDILKWMQESPKTQLSRYKKKVTYYFKENKFSKLKKDSIWNSFGFNLSKNYAYRPSMFTRIWLSRTRRNIVRADGDLTKQRLPQMASFAEKVGL